MDVATLIVGAIGALGGAAGFLALYMQWQDRKARQRVAHIPPEMRPVLLGIADRAAEVARQPRDRAWVDEHVSPLIAQYRPLSRAIEASGKEGTAEFGLLEAHLASLEVYAALSSHPDMHSASEVAHRARKQTDAGANAVELAHELLHTMSAIR